MIVIIDYGMGNLHSIHKKFNKMDVECIISSKKEDIEKADKLILPGVGHFKAGMNHLKDLGVINLLTEKVLYGKTPILGICLGVQLFCNYSEEGDWKGLSWIDSEVIRFRVSDKIKFKVPHMGWNNIKTINKNCLDEEIDAHDEFYFVHSYHLKCNNTSDIWMTSVYDYEFVSAIHLDNIYGTQFHPEKSHEAGMKIIKRFAEI